MLLLSAPAGVAGYGAGVMARRLFSVGRHAHGESVASTCSQTDRGAAYAAHHEETSG